MKWKKKRHSAGLNCPEKNIYKQKYRALIWSGLIQKHNITFVDWHFSSTVKKNN